MEHESLRILFQSTGGIALRPIHTISCQKICPIIIHSTDIRRMSCGKIPRSSSLIRRRTKRDHCVHRLREQRPVEKRRFVLHGHQLTCIAKGNAMPSDKATRYTFNFYLWTHFSKTCQLLCWQKSFVTIAKFIYNATLYGSINIACMNYGGRLDLGEYVQRVQRGRGWNYAFFSVHTIWMSPIHMYTLYTHI